MGGGLIQLVAYGAQDVYLTGNPQITFFKSVYRRHTNFSMETIEHPITNADFGKKSYVVVTRNGDLITKVYLRVVLPSISVSDSEPDVAFAWVRKIGTSLLQNYNIEIGGAEIDKQYGDWLNIWHELTSDISQDRGYNKLIGDVPELTRLEKARTDGSNIIKDEYHLFIPLMYWFCKNYGLALPLIALQYHEVRFNFFFRPFSECVVYTKNATRNERSFVRGNSGSVDASVLVDYIYLDSDERRRFAQVGHEYLIDQLQFTNSVSVTSGTMTQQLFFNHPVKALFWALQVGSYQGNTFLAYSNTPDWSTALEIAAQSIALGRAALDNLNNVIFDASGVPSTYTFQYTGPAAVTLVQSATSSPGPNYSVYQSNVLFPSNVVVTVVGAAPTGIYVLNTGANGTPSGGILTPKTANVNTDDLALKVLINSYAFLVTSTSTVVTPVALNFGQANLVSNGLTIQDISKPLEKFNDNRNVVVKQTDVVVWQHHNHGLLINETINPVVAANIKLNGHDRFSVRGGSYFNYLQPWQHFVRTPDDGVNVYSFAIKPIEHQPSGACNFSRIDTAQLNLWFEELSRKNASILNRAEFLGIIPGLTNTIPNTQLFIYALNYNVLRVMSGMAGLAYSS
jgi:hypothetical protein